MIEINLLPGGRKKAAATTRSSIDFAALASGLTAKFGNPILVGAAAVVVITFGAVGWMYVKQSRDRNVAESRLHTALDDSTRYASIVAERATLEAKRDTLLRQVNLIHSIDEDRYIWPHILDEVSRALPGYTWITLVQFAGVPAGSVNVVALPKVVPPPFVPPPPAGSPRDTTAKAPVIVAVPKVKPMPTAIPKDEITFRVTGRTVDIQALTRFMRDLSLSPFVGTVDIEPVTPGTDQGKEMYQFTLSVRYRRPDSTALRRLPLVLTVR
jgi:Tfp pilus assembly protein PilN